MSVVALTRDFTSLQIKKHSHEPPTIEEEQQQVESPPRPLTPLVEAEPTDPTDPKEHKEEDFSTPNALKAESEKPTEPLIQGLSRMYDTCFYDGRHVRLQIVPYGHFKGPFLNFDSWLKYAYSHLQVPIHHTHILESAEAISKKFTNDFVEYCNIYDNIAKHLDKLVSICDGGLAPNELPKECRRLKFYLESLKLEEKIEVLRSLLVNSQNYRISLDSNRKKVSQMKKEGDSVCLENILSGDQSSYKICYSNDVRFDRSALSVTKDYMLFFITYDEFAYYYLESLELRIKFLQRTIALANFAVSEAGKHITIKKREVVFKLEL